jgi:hypothetical protein
MLAPQFGQDRRQVFDGHDVAGADPHNARDAAMRTAGGAQQRGGGGRHDLRVRPERLREVGGIQPPLRSHEQVGPQSCLQRVNMARHGWLRQPKGASGGRQRSLIEYGKQRPIEGPVGIAVH